MHVKILNGQPNRLVVRAIENGRSQDFLVRTSVDCNIVRAGIAAALDREGIHTSYH
jgi:hypothetical protein